MHQQKKFKVNFVFIDYLQLLRSEKQYSTRQDALESVLAQLNKMAKELNIIVIASTQISRGATEKRSDRRPILEDISEIQNRKDIDDLILLYRESYYDKSTSNNTIEFIKFKDGSKSKGIADLSLATHQITNFRWL